MGVFCEINLSKPANGIYTPGSTVSGKIRYRLDKDTVFRKIIVSLKGHGWIAMYENFQMPEYRDISYRATEDYVDIETVIHNKEKGEPLPAGSYETTFNYQLPENIPGSLKYFKRIPRQTYWCIIKYYVRIKFEKPELFSINKRFKKRITVVSGVTPRLPIKPAVYAEQTTLMKLTSMFSSKKSIVNIKATMANSVVKPGESVKVEYEVENSTNLTLKAVKIKLVQVDTYVLKVTKNFKIRDVRVVEDVQGTGVKYGTVQSGETKVFSNEITIPTGLASIDYTRMVARDYAVAITAVIPIPHRNLVLEIPVQVMHRLDSAGASGSKSHTTYWEAMRKDKMKIFTRDPDNYVTSDEE